MSKEYKTFRMELSSGFAALILQVPESEINRKLQAVPVKGRKVHSLVYEDFLLSHFLVNNVELLAFIKEKLLFNSDSNLEALDKIKELKSSLLDAIYLKNPGFKPENIVMDRTGTLRLKDPNDPDCSGSVALVDNKGWKEPEPTITSFNLVPILGEEDNQGDEEDENPFEPPHQDNSPFDGNQDGASDVPYELVPHKWERLDLYVSVRQYDNTGSSAFELLKGKEFQTKRGFYLLVVSLCIEDFSDLMYILDNHGISHSNSPDMLMRELYNICVQYNPFLNFDNLDLHALQATYARDNARKPPGRRAVSFGAKNKQAAQQPEQTKKFKDVPDSKLAKLETVLNKKVIGQPEATKVLSEAILRASVGFKRETQPIGCFLFTGLTGTGKTALAKTLANELCEGSLVRIDCSEYQLPHEAIKLVGAPASYVGFDEGGLLTREVLKRPFSVVLFDEIEKAHVRLHERLLQILDDGILTDNKGNTVSFSDTIIIMTSNLGVKEIEEVGHKVGFGDESVLTQDKMKESYKSALKGKFKPEFINRIDEIITFRKLEHGDYIKILDVMIDEVNALIRKNRGITLSLANSAKEFLLKKGINPKFGARPMWRAIKRELETPLAKEILSNRVQRNSEVLVRYSKSTDALTFTSEPIEDEESSRSVQPGDVYV